MQQQESHQSASHQGAQGGSLSSALTPMVFLPKSAIAECKSFREACHLAWEHRTRKNLTFSHLVVSIEGLHASHAAEYFAKEPVSSKGKLRRELPAKHIAAVQREIGNYALSQWLTRLGRLTLMEEVINSQGNL
jgi:hypothetical protein